jgi:hypothetical protein
LEIRVDTRGLEIRELIKMLKKALVSGWSLENSFF